MPAPMQYNRRFFIGWTGATMIEPKRVLRALAEHWTLLEPLCERFDAGTLSLVVWANLERVYEWAEC